MYYKIQGVVFVRTTLESIMPRKYNDCAAGFDLFSTQAVELDPGKMIKIDTGIQVKLPVGYCGMIKPRSGLALHKQIDVMGGIIDYDYTGTIGVLLINFGDAKFFLEAKQRMAQLLIVKLHAGDVYYQDSDSPSEVKVLPNLASPRGSKGFGSSGL